MASTHVMLLWLTNRHLGPQRKGRPRISSTPVLQPQLRRSLRQSATTLQPYRAIPLASALAQSWSRPWSWRALSRQVNNCSLASHLHPELTDCSAPKKCQALTAELIAYLQNVLNVAHVWHQELTQGFQRKLVHVLHSHPELTDSTL